MMDFRTLSTYYKFIYLLLFIIPLNIFTIGTHIGQGIQWAFFRYQITYLGSSFIPITQDISYILNGVISGKSALSELMIIFAAVGFVIAFVLLLSGYSHAIFISGLITITNGILLLVSSFIQYGIFLHGSSGEAIPVGVPVLFIVGTCMIMNNASDQQKSRAFLLLKKSDFILLFTGCFVIYYLHTTLTGFSNDTIPNQLLPYYILHDHTLYLDQATAYISNYDYAFRFVDTGNGHYVSIFPVVTPILILPFYIIPVTILNIQMDDYFLLFMGKLCAAAISALACTFIFLTCKKIASYKIALASALVFAFATSTWSISSQVIWAHCVVELLLSCALYLVVRNEENNSVFNIVGMGIISGLYIFNRPSDAILIAPFILYVFRFYYEKFRLFVATACISGSPFLLYNLYFFGNPLGGYMPIASRLGFSTTTLFNYLGLIIAPNKGLLIFSPVLILAVIGFLAIPKREENKLNTVLIWCIPVIFLNLAIYALFDDWIGGSVYGPRYLTGILPFLAIAVCLAFSYLFETNILHAWEKTVVKVSIAFLLLISVLVQITGVFFYPIAINSGSISSENYDPWNTDHPIIIESLVYGITGTNQIYLEPVIANEVALNKNKITNEPGKVIL